VQLAIVAVAIATIGIMSITETRILFVIDVAARPAGAALFSSPQEQIFLLFGLMIGMGMGPMQAASRTLVGRLAPPGKVGECYGLFALSGRATAFFAPFLIGVSTQASGSLRASLVVILAMLCLGFLLLAPVKEPAAV
jgi:UMF1 family MFS transporter